MLSPLSQGRERPATDADCGRDVSGVRTYPKAVLSALLRALCDAGNWQRRAKRARHAAEVTVVKKREGKSASWSEGEGENGCGLHQWGRSHKRKNAALT